MTKNTYYVTTPLYYANAELHIGSAYTTIAADVLARYKRLSGYDVFFLTGTDEHGQKIKKAADEAGVSVREFVQGNVDLAQNLWKDLDITYDRFIRTTDEEHEKTVTTLYNKILEKGDIYEGEYEGYYCEGCERYYTDKELEDGKCPILSEHKIDLVKEKNRFFRLSKYTGALLERMENDPKFLGPESRRNELINRLKEGLDDISISRSNLEWGIPVPDNPEQVLWVWFDALTNYISGIGYPNNMEQFNKYWPADLHLMAKDIPWFHAVIWPAMLLAADIEPAKAVFAHGYWTMESKKISKSLGNIVYPREITSICGSDTLRYFMMREVPFGGDGDFKMKTLYNRYDSDLLKDFGNLENRTVSMISRYCDGVIPSATELTDLEKEVQDMAAETVKKFQDKIETLAFSVVLEDVWNFIRRLNKYAEECMPWKVAKDETQRARLETILVTMAEGIRISSVLVAPFMPRTAELIWTRLGLGGYNDLSLPEAYVWGDLLVGKTVSKEGVVFQQLEYDEETNSIKPKEQKKTK